MDGHNRFIIAKKHPEIPFTVHETEFANRYEAIIWICKNQLGRRNLTPEQKKYLIGKQYEAEKCVNGGDRKSPAAKSGGHFDHLINPKRLVNESLVKRIRQTALYEGLNILQKVWMLPKKLFPAHARKCFPARSSRPPPRLHLLPVPLPKNVRHWWLRFASRSPQNRLHKSRKLPQP